MKIFLADMIWQTWSISYPMMEILQNQINNSNTVNQNSFWTKWHKLKLVYRIGNRPCLPHHVCQEHSWTLGISWHFWDGNSRITCFLRFSLKKSTIFACFSYLNFNSLQVKSTKFEEKKLILDKKIIFEKN